MPAEEASVISRDEDENRDLKQTGRQRDDDNYSHNDIPDLVQNK
jgi:hypothetical protein